MVKNEFLAFLRTLPRIEIGHVLDVLARLPEQSVHCVVTSPPYWGLRDYKLPPQVWPDGWRGSLGLEPAPELYVAHLVECFRAVRRVLRDDGVAWLNLGDSMSGGKIGRADKLDGGGLYNGPQSGWSSDMVRGRKVPIGFKPLDQVGIPHRVYFALQADGWYGRADVVWHNLNAMPESMAGWRWERCRVKVALNKRSKPGSAHALALLNSGHGARAGADFDSMATWRDCPGCPKCASTDGLVLRRGAWRPTGAHEYVFLLAKTLDYFCDGEAVKTQTEIGATSGNKARKFGEAVGLPIGGLGRSIPWTSEGSGANLRDVWAFPTEPLRDAHFAAFPRRLPELCIKAGTSEQGCCPRCGASWARVVERTWPGEVYERGALPSDRRTSSPQRSGPGSGALSTKSQTLGWRPTCACPMHEPVPCVVLDPFAGSGTTLRVAEDLGRLWVGVDLSDAYLKIIRKRTAQRSIFGTVGRLAVEKARVNPRLLDIGK